MKQAVNLLTDFFNDFLLKEFLIIGNLIISFIVFVQSSRWRTLQDDGTKSLASINS